ncbi:MAG: hypothetical protein LBW85_01710 [Deltaproteobacteria bacterium]|jgi:hypothetical protein|nr:hypothetical protein [Deltaproteobacteria bacterium]
MATESQISCPSCGGTIDVIPGQSKYDCPWCGNAVDLFKAQTPAAAAGAPSDVQRIVPFKISENDLHALVMHMVIQPDYAPDDILSAGNVESKELLYLPFWQLTGSSDINWTASFGYDRQEPYTDYVTETRNGRTYSRPVTRYRTVTDWRPASGKARADFTVRVYAGEAQPPPVTGLLENGLLAQQAAAYAPAYVAGYSIEPFAKSPEEVQGRVAELVDPFEASAMMSHAQGDRQRDWQRSSKRTFQDPVRCLMPLARAVFSYKDRNYVICADGVSFASVLTDQPLPVDKSRGSRVQWGFAPLWASLLSGIAAGFATDMEYAHPILLAGPALALVFGLLRRSSILGFSRRFRKASLAQKRLDEYMQLGNLSYEEAERLKTEAVLPSKPLLARTGPDPLTLTLLSLTFSAVTAFGFFAMMFL